MSRVNIIFGGSEARQDNTSGAYLFVSGAAVPRPDAAARGTPHGPSATGASSDKTSADSIKLLKKSVRV
ncbi:jg768 [Pararge aegeria aegeria]|uniref:Jg768 protein n=1 Tax=Pararge aegeria aegeria TaxID=348720 RepID=A0A8S4S2X4_9NEOP|nr:jg768 [Pararge aegeria aegeria]